MHGVQLLLIFLAGNEVKHESAVALASKFHAAEFVDLRFNESLHNACYDGFCLVIGDFR